MPMVPLRRPRTWGLVGLVKGQWWVLATLITCLCLAVGYVVLQERQTTLRRERDILQAQARAVDDNLSQHLQGISAALTAIRDDVGSLLRVDNAVELSDRLRAMSDAMPSVRTMLVVNAEGIVVAASRPELVGTNLSQRPYFQRAKARPDPDTLYLSEPFVTTQQVFSINLVKTWFEPDGRFGGVVSATLDPTHFEVLLRSVLYAPGARSALVHGNGRVFLEMPTHAGTDHNGAPVPPPFFAQHRASGLIEGFHTGPLDASGDNYLLAIRDTQTTSLRLDQALVTTVSRPTADILESWTRATRIYALLFGAIVAMAVGGMTVLQHKQRDVELHRLAREQAVREQTLRMQMALDGGDLGLWEVDLVTGERSVDARSQRMVGLQPAQRGEAPAAWMDRIHPDDRPDWLAARDACLAGQKEAFVIDHRVRHENGSWTWLHSRAKVTARDPDGRPVKLMGTYLDISDRKAVEARIARSEQLLARMSRVSQTGGWDYDLRTGHSTWSEEMFRIRELDPLVDPDRHVVMNAYEPESRARLQAARQAAIDHQEPWDMELQMITAKGHLIWVRSQGEAVVENGVTVALTGTLNNVTSQKQAQIDLQVANEKLERLALSDGLTGIANRRLFDQMLQSEWTRSARTQMPLCLLMIDVDHFKRYNDHYGHAGGDDCLRQVARLLAGCSRRAGDLVCRYGGEEFAILLPSTDLDSACSVAQACVAAVRNARMVHAASPTGTHVTISIGVACLQAQNGELAQVLVERADAALYRAKHQGRNQFAVDTLHDASDADASGLSQAG